MSSVKADRRCRPLSSPLLLLTLLASAAATGLTSNGAEASRTPAGRRAVARSPVDIFDDWQSADEPAADGGQLADRGQAAALAQASTTKSAPLQPASGSKESAPSGGRTTAARSPIWLTMTPNGTIGVVEGEGRDIHCRIYNKPQSAQVQWYYIKRRPNGYGFSNYTVIANQHITINSEKFKTAYSYPGTYTLSIKYFELGDDGQYSCFLYVGFSEAYRESVRVNVLPRGTTAAQHSAPAASSAPATSTAASTTASSDSRTAVNAVAATATQEVPTPAASSSSNQPPPPTSAAAAPQGISATAASSAASATANPGEVRGGGTTAIARQPTPSAAAASSAATQLGGGGGSDHRPPGRSGSVPTKEKSLLDGRSKDAAASATTAATTTMAAAATTRAAVTTTMGAAKTTTAESPSPSASTPTDDVALDGSELEHMLPEVETQPWSRGSPSVAKAATTRCEYQLVINEVDASTCPSLSRSGAYSYLSNNEIYQGDASAAYREHHPTAAATAAGVNALSEKIERLEDRLIDEMVKTQIVNHTASEHEERLQRVERAVAEQARNASSLSDGLQRAEAALERQRVTGRSLDEKLASVMINVAEMSARLDKAMKKVAAIKPDEKAVDVLSAAEAAGCAPLRGVPYFKDCDDAFQKGNKASDVYYVKFIYSACPVPVWCDMDTWPGGWLVLQRRRGGSQRFNMNWTDYRKGFGNVSHDFWLGNDNIFLLTNQAEYMLRVDLWDFYDSRVFAEYRRFKIDGERDGYKLHVGNYSGTAKDSLQKHDGVRFSTPDRDHDQWLDYHCAMEWEAGWWFTNCWHAFLNGQYSNNTGTKFKGMAWIDWKDEQLARTEMKVRPVVALPTPAPLAPVL